jgi:pseudouridine-5'-phosphate glycosidase
MNFISRAGPNAIALETTLLVHGVPKGQGAPLARELASIARTHGATPAIVGVHAGNPIVGLSDAELADLFASDQVAKANTANLGLYLHRRAHAATTVATTMELAALAGVPIFATGGLGGVHRGYADRLDISADLAAFTRFPVAVITSGVKSLLDVASTRELLETLGIPVVGFQTDRFPAFYMRDGGVGVDARFDDVLDLARFVHDELARTKRGIVIANPIPMADEINQDDWKNWMASADGNVKSAGSQGRDVTPSVLSELHRISGGRTLRANLALVRGNVALAARVRAAMPG